MIIAIPEPADGFDKYEQMFLREVIIDVYRNIKEPQDKFIIMAHFELCYTEQEIAQILGVTQEWINIKVKRIQQGLQEMKRQNKL